MSDGRKPFVQPCALRDDDFAESIVVEAYLRLPLLPRQVDGSWVTPLMRYGRFELRLIERVGATPAEPVLRVELLDLQAQAAIESRGCEEVEDAVAAFQTMIPVALTLHAAKCAGRWDSAPLALSRA